MPTHTKKERAKNSRAVLKFFANTPRPLPGSAAKDFLKVGNILTGVLKGKKLKRKKK